MRFASYFLFIGWTNKSDNYNKVNNINDDNDNDNDNSTKTEISLRWQDAQPSQQWLSNKLLPL